MARKKPTIASSMRVPKHGEQRPEAADKPKTARATRARRTAEVPTALTTAETMAATEAVVHVMARMPKSMHKQLKQLALDRDTNIQALLIEATEDVLAKYR